VPGRIVTVASFWNQTEAHLTRAALERAGVECVIADENTVAVNPFYAGAIGGVKVQVPEPELGRAREVLEELARERAAARKTGPGTETSERAAVLRADFPPCPKCRSEDVTYERVSKRVFFLGILLLGFPLLFLKDKWRCLDCGHEWRAR
jgi:hypothetical protein